MYAQNLYFREFIMHFYNSLQVKPERERMSSFHHVGAMDALGEASRRQKGLEKDNQGFA